MAYESSTPVKGEWDSGMTKAFVYPGTLFVVLILVALAVAAS